MSKGYEDLRVWHDAIHLARMVYRITRNFPKSEAYGLASQMQRCAVSVASNIAEGASRQSSKEFKQFVAIALGSLAELHTQSIIAMDSYLQKDDYDMITTSIISLRKMLNSLKSKLNTGNPKLETGN